MAKKLSEMTLEELWELFPVALTEHKAEWAEQYETISADLKGLSRKVVCISHIGSTAIKSIWAKPTWIFLWKLRRLKICVPFLILLQTERVCREGLSPSLAF